MTVHMVEKLSTFPDHIHLFEDMEASFRDPTTASLLRSACASINGNPRRITYVTARREYDFEIHRRCYCKFKPAAAGQQRPGSTCLPDETTQNSTQANGNGGIDP